MIRIGFDRFWIYVAWYVCGVAAVAVVFHFVPDALSADPAHTSGLIGWVFLWPLIPYEAVTSSVDWQKLQSMMGPNGIRAELISTYVILSARVGLRIVRNPFIRWYASGTWIVFGDGALDVWRQGVGRRMNWEFFIMFLSYVFSPLGLWLLVPFVHAEGGKADEEEEEDEEAARSAWRERLRQDGPPSRRGVYDVPEDSEEEDDEPVAPQRTKAGPIPNVSDEPRRSSLRDEEHDHEREGGPVRWAVNLVIFSLIGFGVYKLVHFVDSFGYQAINQSTASSSSERPSEPALNTQPVYVEPGPAPEQESKSQEAVPPVVVPQSPSKSAPDPNPPANSRERDHEVAREGFLVSPFDVPPQIDPRRPLVQPPYPSAARSKHQAGSVVLALVVAPTGKVTQAEVFESSGFPVLDDAAVKTAMEKWRFKPALKDGQPVEAPHRLKVTFKE